MQYQNKIERKKFRRFFMTAREKIYHIYAKDRCLMHSVKEEDFSATWNTLNNMVGLMKTDYKQEDLSYEEVYVNKEAQRNSSY